MGDQTQALRNSSAGGVAGAHDTAGQQPLQFQIAPSTGPEQNRIRFPLIPLACWRVDDVRFAFGSSFVQPDAAEEIEYLQALREVHREKVAGTEPGEPPAGRYPRLSLFGHADPVGTDDYNKQLSGRRATSVYALLVRRTDLWETLYSEPQGDDRWGQQAISTMLVSLGYPNDNSAVSSFQSDHDLAADGQPGPETRKALFQSYMDLLCSPGFVLNAQEDFLAGTDAAGKGDYQGCSEFNPALLFSQQEEDSFSGGQNQGSRNDENAPNRRVVGLLFRVGSRVTAALWPCPRASEGSAGCKKRFWSNGEERRSKKLPADRREFSATKDTFACRFYHRLTTSSPCEAILPLFQVRLYDSDGIFIPHAPYKLQLGASTLQGRADGEGWVRALGFSITPRTIIHWSNVDPLAKPELTPPANYQYSLDLFLNAGDGGREQKAIEQLNNLGYPAEHSLPENTKHFQQDYFARYKLEATGQLDDPTASAIDNAHRTMHDSLRTGASPSRLG